MFKKSNVSGEFKVNIAGQDRVMKATFSAIEHIENNGKPILKMLQETLTGQPKFTDIVDVIWLGLAGNKDTRLSRESIGEAVLSEGMDKFAPIFVEFLTYCVAGDKTSEKNGNPLEKKT